MLTGRAQPPRSSWTARTSPQRVTPFEGTRGTLIPPDAGRPLLATHPRLHAGCRRIGPASRRPRKRRLRGWAQRTDLHGDREHRRLRAGAGHARSRRLPGCRGQLRHRVDVGQSGDRSLGNAVWPQPRLLRQRFAASLRGAEQVGVPHLDIPAAARPHVLLVARLRSPGPGHPSSDGPRLRPVQLLARTAGRTATSASGSGSAARQGPARAGLDEDDRVCVDAAELNRVQRQPVGQARDAHQARLPHDEAARLSPPARVCLLESLRLALCSGGRGG